MAKKTTEEKINLDSILFKCRDILRAARNSGSFFEKRDMMLTLVFLRFIGEKYEDGIKQLRMDLIEQGLDPDDSGIIEAFFDDATFRDGTYNLPPEARWSTIINTPAPQLNVALDLALHTLSANDKNLKGCFIEGTFTTRNLAPNDIKKIVDDIEHLGVSREDTIAFGDGPNDFEMIEFAGIGVAMGNASEDLKEKADMVTTAIDKDGIFNGMKELGLI